MQYGRFLARAKTLRATHNANHIKLFELLAQQEEDILDWKWPRSKYYTWAELLKGEGLCTYAAYRQYKKACDILTPEWLHKLGIYPSISLARLSDKDRPEILRRVKRWYTGHRVPPTYQLVSTYVRNVRRELQPDRLTKVQRMLAYIRACQTLLTSHKIAVPKETWR